VIISADYLHKANISGGDPYCVWLAFEGKGFPRAIQQQERESHSVDRDQRADASGWLASV
jgi:hypothetical protein